MEELRDSYRVIAIDLPGHGAQAHRRFTLADAADGVVSIIERVAGGPAVLVGLSLGGYVAMDVAARRSDLVRGLVLSGATAEPVRPWNAAFLAFAWALHRFDGPRFDALNAWFFRTRYPPEIAEPIVAGGFWASGGAEAVRALDGERFLPRLAAYPGPTLILNGEYDPGFRLFAGRFARAGRDVRRIRLRGATHLASLDRPRAFNAAVRAFVAGLVGGGADEGRPNAPAGRPGARC